MTTSCQTIVDRAKAFSPLNPVLASDKTEMLSRIRADQQELFTLLAGITRDRFQTTASLTSTNGASGRVFDLSALPSPVERVLKLVLVDGREANQVDILDTDAELSPRYFVRGQTLIEVANDWSVTGGAVTATLTYVYGMTDIDPAGALTQNVSVPDQWIDVLVLPLAMYLFSKDPGRDPAEHERLAALFGDRQKAFVSYLEAFGGVESKRFILPAPASDSKKN